MNYKPDGKSPMRINRSANLLVIALLLPLSGMAQSSFEPVALTQSSYTYNIIVSATAGDLESVPECVDAFAGSGTSLSDNTPYEQGMYTRPGNAGYNSGVPIHNSVFTNINDSNMAFLMPPSYTTNDDLMIVNSGSFGDLPSGTLTLKTPTTATSLAILCTGGNGGCTVDWTVTYENGQQVAGNLSVPDWFTGGGDVAWGCNGRMDQNGDFNNLDTGSTNDDVPYLYAFTIPGLSSSSPVASIAFSYDSGGGVDNFFAVSVSTDGTHYTPVPVSGFNEMTIIPAIPFPVTATMDNGTNAANPGNTWFEQGYDTQNPGDGLPVSGSSFTSYSQPSHTYRMASYTTNNATLIDAQHLSANLTPAAPAAYGAISFLTAGGEIIGGNVMTNLCIIQHADGVNETNLFLAYDWFNDLTSAIAFAANGRIYLNSRTINDENDGSTPPDPYLFESYFPLADTASPVTNIVVRYHTSPYSDSTTYILAVSASISAISPIITEEPTPASQTWFPEQTAAISVQVTGTGPITNMWLVESNGTFVPLANGTDARGSIISGAATTTLTISNLTVPDGTNYEYIASNAAGSETSSLASVSVTYVAPPTVTNAPATDVQALTATLNGQVVSSGGEAPNVTLFYGPANGGSVAGNWSNNVAIGSESGAFSEPISSLSPDTTYYFTAEAVNGGGTDWAAPSLLFTTLELTVPVVTNLPASSVQGTIATLNGAVLNTGGQTPAVTLFYGSADGGTNPAAWSNSVGLGLQSGTFEQTISGLATNSTYYFTTEGTNAAGASWATPSGTFTTVATNSPWPFTAVLTQHNDDNRSGDNLTETILNVADVNTNSFGLLYTRPVDDQIYAQPLIMTNVSIPGHGSRNLLIVATVNDSIYAYDADDPTVTQPYWKDSFISPPNILVPDIADENAVGAGGGNYKDFAGNFGIVGTPVIDPASGTLFVVVRTKEISNGTTNFIQRLHALNIATGADEPNSPVVITATYPGTGDGGSTITFDPLRENQRPGLALAKGVVYITWASHGDNEPYHGWVIGYNETNLQQTAVWNDSPNGSESGIWMSGQAPNVDTNGNIYVTVGNGTVDTTTNGDYGESFLKLVPTNGTMFLASYFIPYNYPALNAGDVDLGDAGMLLIPGTTLGISGGKAGVLYLVDRNNMGGLSSGNADTNVLQTWSLNSGQLHGAPVWWSCTNGSFLYIWPASSDHLRQYEFTNGLFNTNVWSESLSTGGSGSPGGIMSVSANGTNAGSGIVWATVNTTSSANQATVAGTLHAFNAQNVTNELWNSDMIPGRDKLGNLAKFVPPTVANGKVYAATFSDQVDVYGLLPLPLLTINVSGSDTLSISWPTNAFLTYNLQSSTNLFSGKWMNATNVPVMTNGLFQVT
ncbi:MAG TPA: hypothetical protein VME24_06390, partial [Alphaproteobacteria bacterium]|nr:hypothetical protein [Alphaproteobacteria bacterium]